jgi:hypothetical protein
VQCSPYQDNVDEGRKGVGEFARGKHRTLSASLL